MKIFLNTETLEQLRTSCQGGRKTVSDSTIPGLSLELRATGEGSWRFRYTFDGKQECCSFGLLSAMSLERARQRANQLALLVKQGENPKRLVNESRFDACPRFKDFVQQYYLPHIRSYKRCVSADVTLLDNHLIPEFGMLRMNTISRQQILDFQRQKQESGYKPAYCNRFLVLLSFCFNLAIKWETPGVIRNPVKLVPLLKANNKIERFMTQDESAHLLTFIRNSPNRMLKYFVLLALLTGMRKREILDAKWQEVDLERGLWLIPHPKSGISRYVPLTPEATKVLKDLKAKLPSLLEQKDWLENPYVVPNLKTGRPFKSIFNSWDTARKKAGLSGLRIHDLRHSFASALVNEGIPIYDVQKLLGHQDVKTTQRYAHFSVERLRSSSSALNKFYDLDLVD